MVKFSFLFQILVPITTLAKPQFGDLFGQIGDTFNDVASDFTNIFGGIDVNTILEDAQNSFNSILETAGGLSDSDLFQNLDVNNLPFSLDDISDLQQLSNDLIENAMSFSTSDIEELTSNFENFGDVKGNSRKCFGHGKGNSSF